jgi:hypothetical protein
LGASAGSNSCLTPLHAHEFAAQTFGTAIAFTGIDDLTQA